MEHVLSSLVQLFSFDHSKCDAILQMHNIEVVNAYLPAKAPGFRNTVYMGLYVGIGWTLVVAASAIWLWRDPRYRSDTRRYLSVAFAVIGFLFIGIQLKAMADYVNVCRSLLNLH